AARVLVIRRSYSGCENGAFSIGISVFPHGWRAIAVKLAILPADLGARNGFASTKNLTVMGIQSLRNWPIKRLAKKPSSR
ncbi:MAG: hypothetical protein P8L32_05920, partial [Paracoccaceae bacterium]|nr:hypothetical protein [Paracoccaceae bacterium]